MKISSITALLLFSAVFIFCGCSKDNAPPPVNDPFKNTIWTGEFKYDSRSVSESYTISFDGKGNFEWEEYQGTYGGVYSIDQPGEKVTLTFNSGSSITAAITNQQSLSAFQPKGSYGWKMLSGHLNTTTEQDLFGTIWNMGSTVSIRFSQMSPSLIFNGFTANYSRVHGALRFTVYIYGDKKCFLVPDGNVLRGIVTDGYSYYQLTLIKE